MNNKGTFIDTIYDRIKKTNRALYLVKAAISTTGNVSVNLALSLFDKHIAPILLYGCCIWGMPDSSNFIYVNNVPDMIKTRPAITEVLGDIQYIYCKKVGKVQDGSKKILVQLCNLNDKITLLSKKPTRTSFGSAVIANYDVQHQLDKIEQVHTRFCEFILNAHKSLSHIAARAELGRFPLYCKILALSCKFWSRAKAGCKNVLLNNIYNDDNMWSQKMKYVILCQGLGNIWARNAQCDISNPYLVLRKRLEDQYLQIYSSNAEVSNSTQLIHHFQNGRYETSKYLTMISNIRLRNIMCKLRTNFFSSKYWHSKKGVPALCNLCGLNDTDSSLVILYCNGTSHERKVLVERIQDVFSGMRENDKLTFVLHDCIQVGNGLMNHIEKYIVSLAKIRHW